MNDRCLVCNWAPHSASVHGITRPCKNGHYCDRDVRGRCRECHRQRAMRYHYRYREQENARSRTYHWTHRDDIIARKRSRRSRGSKPGARHPWRATNPNNPRLHQVDARS